MLTLEIISPQTFDEYAKIHELNTMFQTSNWAKVKSNWTPYYIGVLNNNELIGASLILVRNIILGLKFAYLPKGPLINFSDDTKKFFFKNLIKFLRSKRIIYAKIEPNLILGKLKQENKDKLNNLNSTYKKFNLPSKYIRYKGKGMRLSDTITPRVQMHFPLNENIDSIIPKKILKRINKCKKNDIVVKTECNATSLIEMIKYTEKRHNIHLRNATYFRSILDNYKDDSCVLSAYQNDILLSSCILVKSKDICEILYSGYNDKYRKSDSTYLLRYKAIEWAKEKGCSIFNFGGVDGNLNDGLYMFKSCFNPDIALYLGEVDLLIYPVISYCISLFSPLLKKIIKF
ncbi:MAG: lipid II:glycine glycyltransferase FemX [Anaerorhabdus sp.]